MTELLLKLLGVKVDEAIHIAKASLAFHGGLSFGWLIFLALVAAGLVF